MFYCVTDTVIYKYCGVYIVTIFRKQKNTTKNNMLPNDANERNDKDINHELPSAREKKARSVSRSVKQIMMCHGPRVLSFIVATVVVLTVTMVPVRVSSHCCRALTLHVWVCDSITKRIEKFHQDYIFFYHI